MPKVRKPISPEKPARDGACDPQEHMIEDDTPLAWARQVAEGEAAGLD